MLPKTPPFESLPLQKDGPRGNAWGLYGKDDQLGMLNRLTPETTLAATKEIIHGIRISTDLNLNQPGIPCFGRAVFNQHIHHKAPRTVNDDILTLNTQSSSQWDGFRHYGYQDHKVYFNGVKQEEILATKKNGIHSWVNNGGIVGRGVLLDYYSWAESRGNIPSCLTTTNITVSDLRAVSAAQGVSFLPGDILFIRSGYTNALLALSPAEMERHVGSPPPTAIGVESSKEMLKWLWDNGFAAVAGDMMAFEALPMQSTDFCLHEWILAGWGLPIGELFDLEKLAAECKEKKKWTFFFSSMPLKVPGGVASPPNGVAIL